MPSLPGRTPRRRMSIGTMLVVLGAALVVVALVPLHFIHRVSDRTDVPGTVQEGYNFDSVSASSEDGVATIADGESGYWKVDYEIDGSPHTGLLIGRYSAGQEVLLSAPGDGSVFRVLAEADSGGVKVLSWITALASLAALGLGGLTLVNGMRAASREHQLEANRRAAATYGLPLDYIEQRMQRERKNRWTKGVDEPESAPSPPATQQWQPVRREGQERSAPTGFFHRPYDLDDS